MYELGNRIVLISGILRSHLQSKVVLIIQKNKVAISCCNEVTYLFSQEGLFIASSM